VDIGNISHPDLIKSIYLYIPDQVGIDPEPMVAVRCSNPFLLPGMTLQPLFLHDPGYLLMVDNPSFPLQLPGDPAVSIAGKLQTDVTNARFQNSIRRFRLLLVIKTSAGQVHEFAPPLNALDKGAIFGNELSFFSVRFRLFLMAFFKNSFSRVTLPSKHSNSRTLAASSASLFGSVFSFPSAYCLFHVYN
jgi:hypothetical protein